MATPGGKKKKRSGLVKQILYHVVSLLPGQLGVKRGLKERGWR